MPIGQGLTGDDAKDDGEKIGSSYTCHRELPLKFGMSLGDFSDDPWITILLRAVEIG